MNQKHHYAITVQNALKAQSDAKAKEIAQRFFKTGEGEYAHGDIFLGMKVPQVRALAKEFASIKLSEVLILLTSEIHEERLIALYFLIDKYKKSDDLMKKEIFDIYMTHTKYINNWDLVDTSCESIVGAYLENLSKEPLRKFALSSNLWERRIAIISTFYYIKRLKYQLTFEITDSLLADKHDLIHKAVGWMLREVGKRCSEDILCGYLDINYRKMSRTTLRYAIERFEKEKRLYYLHKK
jgi:3-methyladenine DNA glycosylase AlkD